MVRAFDKWLLPYFGRQLQTHPSTGRIHVVLSVCDHFEPLHDTHTTGALERLTFWLNAFQPISEEFLDNVGVSPRHTFFFPIEQYDSRILGSIAAICHKTKAEVEIHLHHRNDSPGGVEEKLLKGISDLKHHGFLSRDLDDTPHYGFIHGNWALNHCDPQGRSCGVDREIAILRRTGCYADFTMPSAPHPTQARKVNSIYYSADKSGAAALDHGTNAETGITSHLRHDPNRLLLVQGPLALNWRWRKAGIFPRIENADLTGANPPTPNRLRLWTEQRISVIGRPDWIFVKLHTHGGIPQNYNMLLGEPMRRFYQHIEALNRDENHRFRYHFVTAREMVNLIHAAEDGRTESIAELRTYLYPPPPVLG